MVSVRIAITHAQWDEERRGYMAAITRRLGCLPYEVVKDYDRVYWHTARRAWEISRTMDETHLLVLSDDMLPCDNFCRLLNGALAARPTDIIAIFSMRQALPEARQAGLHWVRTSEGAWGGSMVMPAALWHDLLVWERANVQPGYPHDDSRIKLYAENHGLPIMLTAPALVQHLGAATSLLGFSNSRRVASWLADGSDIDWNTDALPRAGGSISHWKQEALIS